MANYVSTHYLLSAQQIRNQIKDDGQLPHTGVPLPLPNVTVSFGQNWSHCTHEPVRAPLLPPKLVTLENLSQLLGK